MQARTYTRTIARADQALRGAVRAQIGLFGGSAMTTSICGLALSVFSMTPNQKRSSESQGNWRHLNANSVKGYPDRPHPGEVSA